jgi:cell division protein FtsL
MTEKYVIEINNGEEESSESESASLGENKGKENCVDKILTGNDVIRHGLLKQIMEFRRSFRVLMQEDGAERAENTEEIKRKGEKDMRKLEYLKFLTSVIQLGNELCNKSQELREVKSEVQKKDRKMIELRERMNELTDEIVDRARSEQRPVSCCCLIQ